MEEISRKEEEGIRYLLLGNGVKEIYEKRCCRCGVFKAVSRTNASEFYYNNSKGRYASCCNACRRTGYWEEKDREKAEEYHRKRVAQDPCGHLIADVLVLAINDWKKEKSAELQTFFSSMYFEELCDATTSVDPDVVKTQIGA